MKEPSSIHFEEYTADCPYFIPSFNAAAKTFCPGNICILCASKAVLLNTSFP
jgi:hypothetical protein